MGGRQPHISHWAIVDCNVVNDPVAAKYPGWLDAGIHILSANLSGASGEQELYAGIQVRLVPCAVCRVHCTRATHEAVKTVRRRPPWGRRGAKCREY